MKIIYPIIPNDEEWKDLNSYSIKPECYMISNYGHVFSKLKNGFISPSFVNGYRTVQLNTIDGKRKTFYIHRLVAEAFVPNLNPSIFIEVNHKDLNRNNSYYKNLEWVTKQENIDHELKNKNHYVPIISGNGKWGDGSATYGENNGMSKWKETEVRCMLMALENGASYAEALIKANIYPTENAIANLSHIARGHRWKHISKEYNIPDKIPRGRSFN